MRCLFFCRLINSKIRQQCKFFSFPAANLGDKQIIDDSRAKNGEAPPQSLSQLSKVEGE